MDNALTQIGPDDFINLAHVSRVQANVGAIKPNPNRKDGDPVERATDAVQINFHGQRDPIFLFDDDVRAFLAKIGWTAPKPVVEKAAAAAK